MFKRRDKLPLGRKIREAVKPSMGYRRAGLYWRHRVFRTGDTTYKITAGLAAGTAVSFSPFIGTHVAQAFLLAWILRTSWVAAFVGTAVGNPATLIFLFWMSWHVGITILSAFGYEDAARSNLHFTLQDLFHHPLTLLAPMTIGGYLCGAAAGLLVYIVLFYPVRSIRRFYIAERKKRKALMAK